MVLSVACSSTASLVSVSPAHRSSAPVVSTPCSRRARPTSAGGGVQLDFHGHHVGDTESCVLSRCLPKSYPSNDVRGKLDGAAGFGFGMLLQTGTDQGFGTDLCLRFARGFAWDESSIFRAAWVCFRLLNYSSLTSFFFQMRFEGFGDQLGIGDLLVEPCLLGSQSL